MYDISSFRHPGGMVIRTHAWNDETRIDATNAFHAFHGKRARAALHRLPSVPHIATMPSSSSEADLSLLRERLERDGYFETSARHVAYRILANAGLCIVAAWLLSNGLWVAGIAVLSVHYVQCGWIQHECGHRSFTGHPRWDAFLQTVYLNGFMGGNRHFWNDQHFAHHANTQNIQFDKDLKTHPLVAFDLRAVERRGHTWFTKRQHLLYWWLINPMVWAVWSFVSHPLFAYRRGHLREYASTKALSLIGHAWYFVHVCGCARTVWEAIAWFHVMSLLGSCVLLATFTVSHTTTGSYASHRGWVYPAAHHTVNVRDHWFTNWWMGYLNFQVEHHLFPTMPQFRQPCVGENYVRPFFYTHGLPYKQTSFWGANCAVYRNLRKIARSSHA